MEKQKELSEPKSCFNKAGEHEILFILLERDITTPATIRFWVSERIKYGKNKIDDPQIVEALQCAKNIEHKRAMRE